MFLSRPHPRELRASPALLCAALLAVVSIASAGKEWRARDSPLTLSQVPGGGLFLASLEDVSEWSAGGDQDERYEYSSLSGHADPRLSQGKTLGVAKVVAGGGGSSRSKRGGGERKLGKSMRQKAMGQSVKAREQGRELRTNAANRKPKKFRCNNQKNIKKLATDIISAIRSKGYTIAAAAFNATGALEGVPFKTDILVPTDEAFLALPSEIKHLLNSDTYGMAILQRLVREHMLRTARKFRALKRKKQYQTYLRTTVKTSKATTSSGVATVAFTAVDGYNAESSKIIVPDLFSNCLGHHQGVDKVLIPHLDFLLPPGVQIAPAPAPFAPTPSALTPSPSIVVKPPSTVPPTPTPSPVVPPSVPPVASPPSKAPAPAPSLVMAPDLAPSSGDEGAPSPEGGASAGPPPSSGTPPSSSILFSRSMQEVDRLATTTIFKAGPLLDKQEWTQVLHEVEAWEDRS